MEKAGIGIECKKIMAEEIKRKLADSGSLFVTSFGGMVVAEQDHLRQQLKEVNSSLFVIKKRLTKFALDKPTMEAITPRMQGLTALALGGDDPIPTAKTLVKFAAKNEGFKILAGYVDKQILDLPLVKKLALIPSREVLLAQVVGGIKSPIQGLMNTLSATLRKFVVVLDKIKQKK